MISKGYASTAYWETITSQQNASVAVFNSTHGTTPDLFGSVRVSTASECHTAGTYTGTIYFILRIPVVCASVSLETGCARYSSSES